MTENSSNVFYLNTKENPWWWLAQSKCLPTILPTCPLGILARLATELQDTRLRFPPQQNQFAGFICYLLALIADKMNLTVKWCIIKGGGSRSGLVNGPFNRIWNWIILLDFNPIQRMDFLELIWRCNSEDNHCLGITKIMMDGFHGIGIGDLELGNNLWLE